VLPHDSVIALAVNTIEEIQLLSSLLDIAIHVVFEKLFGLTGDFCL
jgi:hypothetical protein